MSCGMSYALRYPPSVRCNIRDQTSSNEVASARVLAAAVVARASWLSNRSTGAAAPSI